MAVENLTIYREQLNKDVRQEVATSVTADKKVVALTLMEYLVKGTPVDTGETRKRWHFSVGVPTQQDKIGGDPLADLQRLLGNDKAWEDPMFIQNNGPAAAILEFGLFQPPDPGPSKDPRIGRKGRVLVKGGFSTQAPTGIVADAVTATARRLQRQEAI